MFDDPKGNTELDESELEPEDLENLDLDEVIEVINISRKSSGDYYNIATDDDSESDIYSQLSLPYL